MKTFLTAARFYAGYKLKALSFLVFITIGLGLIMGAVDFLYNSFNIFFDRPASYFLPRYFVSSKKDFDILRADYTIADIALKADQRTALAESSAGISTSSTSPTPGRCSNLDRDPRSASTPL